MEGFDAEGFDAEGFSVVQVAYPYTDPFGLLRTGRRPSVLVEVATRERQRDPGAIRGKAKTLVFSTGPVHFGPDDSVSPHLSPLAMISEEIGLRQGFDPGLEGGPTELTLGDLRLVDRRGEDGEEVVSSVVANTHVDGEEVIFYLGPEGSPREDYLVVGRARAREWTAELGEDGTRRLALALDDLQGQLEASVQPALFGGGGEMDGPPSLQGQRKPLLIGRRVHLEPTLIDPASRTYMVSTGPILINTALLDGIEVTVDADYPDYEALRDAVIPEGRVAPCRRRGLVRARPSGGQDSLLSLDVTGHGAVLISECLRALLIDVAGQPASRVGAFAAARFASGGWYYPGGTDDPTVMDAAAKLSADVFGRFVTSPSYDLVLFKDPRLEPPEVELYAASVVSMRMIGKTAPIYPTFEVRYAPNDRVVSEADVADSEEDGPGFALRSRPYRSVELHDEEAAADHPTARERYVRDSSVIEEAAADEVLRRMQRYGAYERVAWEIDYRLDRLPCSPGQIARLQIDGDAWWGFGRTMLVYEVEPRITEGRVVIRAIQGIAGIAIRTPVADADPHEFDFDTYRTTTQREHSDEFDPAFYL